MAWLRHTWRVLSRRHVALPAVVIFGPLLVVALVAALVVNATTGDGDETNATTAPTTATGTPDADSTFLAELPSSCVEPEEAACALRTGSLALVADSGTVEPRADGAIGVEGDVSIPTAGGDVDLIDSDLVIDVDDDGNIVDIDGTADAPLPDFGALSAALLLVGARAEVGYAWGRDLLDLGAHLQPDRQYFWFKFESTWAMRTGFDQVIGDADALPVSLSTPGDVSVTMVLDPIDPYFYIGGPCPSFDSDNGDTGGGSDDGGSGNGRSGNGGSGEVDNAELSVGAADGEDCGLGVSEQGNIPFEATTSHEAGGEFPPFDGHIVVDHSEIPVMKGVVLDGTMVIRDGSNLALGGNGDILLSVPLVANALDLSLLIGNASAGLRLPKGATGGAADTFIAGVLDSDLLADDIPDWMPVEPAEQAEILAAARVVSAAGEGQPFTADSYIEMTGAMATTPSFLPQLTSVGVNPIEAADAVVRMDTTGIRVDGTTTASIHPSIDVGGDLLVDGYVGLVDPAASYFELVGAAGVGGVSLGEALIRLGPGRVEVSGATVTPISTIGLQGQLSDEDILLRGSTRAEASTADASVLVDRAGQLVDDARTALVEIDAQIDEARELVRQARVAAVAAAEQTVADAERLRDQARTAIDDAQDAVDDLRDDLDAILDEISELFPIGDIVERLIPRSLRVDRDQARAALERAEDTVDDLSDDLSSAGDAVRDATAELTALVEEHGDVAIDEVSDVAERLAERRTLADALAAAENTASILSGSVALDIDVQVATSGITGAVAGEVCSVEGCLDIGAGTVRFDDEPEACVAVLGVDVCVPF